MTQVDKDVYERRALEIKHNFEKENALARQMGLLKPEPEIAPPQLQQQQQQQQSQQHQPQLHQNVVSQQMYVTASPAQGQRNFIQLPQTGQSLLPPVSNPLHQNANAAPIHYFQASNGQVLQFISSPNVQPGATGPAGTATGVQFSTSATVDQGQQQQHALLQQQQQPLNQSSQQVIYQLASHAQNGQALLGSGTPFQNSAQYLMPPNKIGQFASPQQLPAGAQQAVQMQAIGGMPPNSGYASFGNPINNPNVAAPIVNYALNQSSLLIYQSLSHGV